MLNADVVGDLSADDKNLYNQLRQFNDVLLLKQMDPLHVFQTRLRSMHNLGMLNLSLGIIDEKDKVHQISVKYRSLVCRVREANKRTQAATNHARREENEKLKIQKLLDVAKAQVAAFRSDYPEWVPPESLLLPKPQDEEFRVLFAVSLIPTHPTPIHPLTHTHTHTYTHTYVHIIHTQKIDRDVDLEKQMRMDPTGLLTTMWVEQRRMLERKKQTRWNPKVTHTCVYACMYAHMCLTVVCVCVSVLSL